MPFDNSSRAGYEKYYSVLAERWGWKPSGDAHSPARTKPVFTHYNEFHFGQGQRALATRVKDALGLKGPTVVAGAGFGWTVEGLEMAGVGGAIGTEISPYILANKDESEESDIRDYCGRSGIDPDVNLIIGPPDHPKSEFIDGEWRIRPLDIWLPRGLGQPRAQSTIADEDAATSGSHRRIRRASRDQIAHIVTEELLNSVTDDEALRICEFYERLATGPHTAGTRADVCHMLSPPTYFLNKRPTVANGLDLGTYMDDPDNWTPGSMDPDLNWKHYEEWRSFLDAAGFAHHRIICTVPLPPTPFAAPRQWFEVL